MDSQDRTFPQFSRLPPELRQYIWQLALPPASQVYSISYLDPHVVDPFSSLRWSIVSCPRRGSVGVLQACHEARGSRPGYHIARRLSAEVVDPCYASKIVDFDSEHEFKRLNPRIVYRPFTTISVHSFCCSNLDLVIVNPWTWRIDRKEGMSYHITTSTQIDAQAKAIGIHNIRFQGIRYVALSLNAYFDWAIKFPRTLKRPTFTGVDVLFIVKELPPLEISTPAFFVLLKWALAQDKSRKVGRKSSAYTHANAFDTRDIQCVDTVNDAMKEIEKLNGARCTLTPLPSLSELIDSHGLVSGT